MASIKQTKNGGYRIRVSAGFDGNGKRQFYTETYTPTAKTPKAIEKELQKYVAILEQKVHDGLISISDGTTFSQFVDTWAEQWASEHLTISQQEAYADSIRLHVVPAIGNLKMAKIKKKDMIQIVANLKKEGLSPKSIRRIVTAARSVFRYALYLEIINSDPCDSLILPPLEKDNGIHCFDLMQAQRFLNALSLKYPKKHGGRKRKDSSGKEYQVKPYVTYQEVPFQFQVFFNLAIKGGFRRGELIGLTWNDIDFARQTITINKAVSKTKQCGQIVGEPKTPSSYRTVFMPLDAIDMLEQWLDTQKELCTLSNWKGMPKNRIMENPVFIQHDGKRMDLDTPKQRFTSVLKAFNEMIDEEADQLPTPEAQARKRAEKLPVITLHDLRHTFATLLIANNTDIVTVSKLMGHSSPSVTMDVYSHLLKQNAEQAAQVFERLFNTTTSAELTMQA